LERLFVESLLRRGRFLPPEAKRFGTRLEIPTETVVY
jgi:hypothetical protein